LNFLSEARFNPAATRGPPLPSFSQIIQDLLRGERQLLSASVLIAAAQNREEEHLWQRPGAVVVRRQPVRVPAAPLLEGLCLTYQPV